MATAELEAATEGELEQDVKEKLMEDLRLVVTDAEELLKATAGQAGDQARAARAKMEESLKMAKEKLVAAEATLVERARVAAKATDGYVRAHPWESVGIGTVVGLVVGILIARR